MENWILNGTFLISYVKFYLFFILPKTCLSHGKKIAFFLAYKLYLFGDGLPTIARSSRKNRAIFALYYFY